MTLKIFLSIIQSQNITSLRIESYLNYFISIETVVAQLVQEDFVGGKIMGIAKLMAHLVNGKQQRGLAQLVLVQAVLQMAQR